MLLPALVRAAGGFRNASCSFRAITATPHRTIFYPSASQPSAVPKSSQKSSAQYPAHVSREQFDIVRQSSETSTYANPAFSGLVTSQTAEQDKVQLGVTPKERWYNASKSLEHDRRQLGPPDIFSGRTVFLRSGDTVAQAYARLQHILRVNNVRKELKLAERHEKKGAKRRRLRSERWRRKFADEVRKKVKLVTEIRLRDRMWGARH